MFERAIQNRVFQDVVEQIQAAIIEGRLTEGEKLPPERELKESFGVSRGALREALRVLEQKGLIEIRLGVGGGAFVKSASTAPMTESLSLLLKSRKATRFDIAEFRKDLEGSMVRLAARRRSEEDIVSLRDLLAKMGAFLTPELNPKAVLDVDHEIHKRLADISGNPVYRVVQETIQDNISPYYDQYVPRDATTLSGNLEDLQILVNAIEAGDEEGAVAAMSRHLGRYDEFI